MKRVIVFGTMCMALVLASSVMARHAEPEEAIFHQALPGLDDVHGYDFTKSRGDTLYLLGGRAATANWANQYIFFDGHGQPLSSNGRPPTDPRWIIGKFADINGIPHWTGWDRSHMWTGILPSGRVVDPRPGFDSTYIIIGPFSVTDDDGSPLKPHWDPTMNPNGVDLTIDNKTLWWGCYAEDTWGQPPSSNYKEPGYGNNWDDVLRCKFPVGNPSQPVTVTWTYDIQWEIEENWDFIYVQYWDAHLQTWAELRRFTGTSYPADTFTEMFTLSPAQHQGIVSLRYWFYSDSAYSDEDGFYNTQRGGAQLDNIYVHYDWVTGSGEHLEDFEIYIPAPCYSQGIFGCWHVEYSYGVGNYAQLWKNPGHLAECQFNSLWQAIFVNDGQYYPDVPAASDGPWTYGPGGYQVEPSSGLTGHLEGNTTPLCNGIVSPVFALYEVDSEGLPEPDGIAVDNIWLQFDCYRHHEYPNPAAPWIFYRFSMRSTPGAPHTIDDYDWVTSDYYYGGPDYIRTTFNISTWPEPGARYAQIGLWASQLMRQGTHSSPAPYFDNVTVIGFPTTGPSVSADHIYTAQDDFPPQAIPGTDPFDPMDPNWRIRFDGAWDINPRTVADNWPGDSITINVTPVRAGYTHHPTKKPRAYVTVKANPLFADVADGGPRDYSLADPAVENIVGPDANHIYTFEMPGHPTHNPNIWWFDMDGPKTEPRQVPTAPVFFPGDIIHYYIEGWDYNPVTQDEGRTTWPANLDWFGNFEGYDATTGESGRWFSEFTVYGLPSLYDDDGKGITQPKILWVNAFWTRGGENEWYSAFKNAGYQPWGTDPVQGASWNQDPVYFDQYNVNRPDNNGGNHIGGRVFNAQTLAGYKSIVFSFGDLSNFVMGSGEWINGSYPNKANCLEDIRNWLELGGKCLILSGDELAYSNVMDPIGPAFNTQVMGANFINRSIRSQVEISPFTMALAGNGAIQDNRAWITDGGCPSINRFNEVEAISGVSTRFAGFAAYGTCPSGFTPVGNIAAGIWNVYAASNVFFMPFDLMYVRDVNYSCPDHVPCDYGAMRSCILGDLLSHCHAPGQVTSVTPDAGVLTVSTFPNPFNPATTIKLSLPRPGEVSLKVYNVRGELVRTLVNDVLQKGNHDIIWDGTNDRGAQTASGIYFYEVRTGGEVKVGKMALIK